jgi:hypothetical protein
MVSVAGGNKGPDIQKVGPANCKNSLGKGSIHSAKVILVEGDADDFIPYVESATGTHGFVIMVPVVEKDGWLLDMLWRVTMAYAGLPSLVRSRSNVQKMVEAVMNYKSRPARHGKSKASRSPAAKQGRLRS